MLKVKGDQFETRSHYFGDVQTHEFLNEKEKALQVLKIPQGTIPAIVDIVKETIVKVENKKPVEYIKHFAVALFGPIDTNHPAIAIEVEYKAEKAKAKETVKEPVKEPGDQE